MNRPALVQVLKAVERLADEPHRLGERQPLAPVEHLVERLAFQVLHHDVVDAAGLADLIGADHVRVVELREQPGLALEPAEDVRVLRLRRRQDLQRDELAEVVDGLVHAAHLPLADLVEDLVPAEEEAVRAAALNERRLVLGERRAWRRGTGGTNRRGSSLPGRSSFHFRYSASTSSAGSSLLLTSSVQ